MGLIEKIEELQNRPKAERKKIFAVALAASMIIIIGIWITLLGHNLRGLKNNEAEKAPRPLGLVWESAREAVNDLQKEMIEKMENISN